MQSKSLTLKSILIKLRLRAVAILCFSLMIGLGGWLSTRHNVKQVADIQRQPGAALPQLELHSDSQVATASARRVTDAQVSIPTTTVDEATETRLVEEYGKLPMQFEANEGQVASEVKFLSRGSGYTLFLTPTEAVLSLKTPAKSKADPKLGARSRDERRPVDLRDVEAPRAREQRASRQQGAVVRMQLVNGNSRAQIAGAEELPGKTNYLIGNDPQQWRTNVSTYKKVKYEGVYPGVDLVYYGNQRQLEYDFTVSPGADPRAIRLKFMGAEQVIVDEAGELVLKIRGGEEIRQQRPVIYQDISGERREVTGKYALHGKGEVGFEITAYDASRSLVIDPILTYSTYLGGHNNDRGYSIAVDAAGNAYVTGDTDSTFFFNNNTFPTVNPILPLPSASFLDVFVTKFNPAGTALIYSTYFGGSNNETGYGIAVDSAGDAYVTGETYSSDFPLVSPRQSAKSGITDAFVTKLNAAGNGLVYSTYHGGNGQSYGRAVAVDSAGNAYVTGDTSSSNFPMANPRQPMHGGISDAFVSKFNAAGSALVYSTYHGGSGGDYGYSIAVDSSGSAYVTGYTTSNNFPTAGPNQPNPGGLTDTFVTKFNATGTVLTYSTYLGGTNFDVGYGIAVDSSGNAYVTGRTDSNNFPTANALRASSGGSSDAFVTKFNPAGSVLIYSTYLGGGGSDYGTGIAVDSSGNAYIGGYTYSTNFPVVNALQGIPADGGSFSDAFVTKLNTSGSALVYSSYFGGTGNDSCQGIAKNSNATYIVGITSSKGFPVTAGALQPSKAGSGSISDAFVAKIDETSNLTYYAIGGQVTKDGQPLPGVNITLSGSSSRTITTNAEGRYFFPLLLGNSNYTVTPDSNYNCTPLLLNHSPLTSNIANADFTVTQLPSGWATVSGNVRNVNGRGLSATVRISGDLVAEKSISGFYSFDLPPGGGTFTVSAHRFPVTSFSPVTFSTFGQNRTFDFFATSPLVTVTGQLMNLTQGSSTIQINVGGTGLASKACDISDSGGVFQYVCSDLSIYGDYLVVPTSTTYNFDPTSRDYRGIGGNVAGAHFAAVIPQPPTLTTSAATTVTLTGATLNGNVNPNGLATDAWFEWGTSATLSTNTETTHQPIVAGGSSQPVSAGLTGLTAGTTYYFRVVGMNIQGTTRGSILNFTTPIQVTVQTSPTGRSFMVDGTSYSSAQTFNWIPSATHTISTTSPQSGATGTQYVWTSWSDDGGISHTVAPNSTRTYTANFTTQHLLTMTAGSGGNVSPASGFFNSGQIVTITATANALFTFAGWTGTGTGSFTGSTNPATVTMNGPVTETASFSAGPTPTPMTIQFGSSTATATETLNATTKLDLTVTRSGNTSGSASVNYASSNGTANERSDYLAALGTVRFQAGETAKTISVFIVDDSFGETSEGFTVTLSNPVGASLVAPATSTVTINSNETVDGPNPVKDPSFNSDFFVRQHYVDFFYREADAPGLAFWKNQIDECTTQPCREIRRINVSAAFFLSGEFQQTGYLVYKSYQAAFNTGEQLDLRKFLPDTQEIGRGVIFGQPGADQLLETNKQNFFLDFVQRPAFLAPDAYPTTLTAAQFVDKLNANTLDPLNPGAGPALTPSQRQALIDQLAGDPTSPSLRGQVLRSVSENGVFHQRQFNKAFVLMQYFGYLRRNPNSTPDTNFDGYNFWLGKLNQFNGQFVDAEMVKAFISSSEYINRFGP